MTVLNSRLNEAFLGYLQERTLESFLAARSVLVALPSYDPWSPELAEFDHLLETNDWETLEHRALQEIDNWMLTPYVHECLALARANLGDEEGAAFEMQLFAACAEGILMTGDGSPSAPYTTIRVDDAYGALLYREVEWTDEREAERDGRSFHILTGKDGQDWWFDITAARAARRSRQLS